VDIDPGTVIRHQHAVLDVETCWSGREGTEHHLSALILISGVAGEFGDEPFHIDGRAKVVPATAFAIAPGFAIGTRHTSHRVKNPLTIRRDVWHATTTDSDDSALQPTRIVHGVNATAIANGRIGTVG
jgi:hypothetical protein